MSGLNHECGNGDVPTQDRDSLGAWQVVLSRPMVASVVSEQGEGRIAREVRRGLTLLGHQLSATFLVMIWAGALTAMALSVPRLWGRIFRVRDIYPLMTASPYYPIQILVGVLWGWLRGFVTRERMMLWVWVCPLAVLVIAILARADTYPSSVMPGSMLSEYSSIRSYFFGWGCRPRNGCIEQIGTTLPFYASEPIPSARGWP